MNRFLACITGFWIFATAAAQNGSVTGTVSEKNNTGGTDAVVGAIVYIDSTAKGRVGTQTDFDGKFRVPVAPGTYSVTCKYLGYPPMVFRNVKVEAGKNTEIVFQFDPEKNLLDSNKIVNIYGERPTGTGIAVLDTIRKGNSQAIGISGADIRKTFVPDAAQAARKLPGVTLVDNRFVVVRGLSERYNAVWLNNVNAPSVETDVKAFSFDLIPSSMIDNFMIYQSPSAELPGEFSGGAIRINTTDIPGETGLQVSLTGAYRNGTTFRDFNINKGSSSDLLAMGAASRGLPAEFPANLRPLSASGNSVALQDAGRSLQNNWGHTVMNAPADIRFSTTFNYRYSNPKFQFGSITGINYSNTYTSFSNYRLDYNAYDTINGHSDTVFFYNDLVSRQSVRAAFIENLAIRFGTGGSQRITFKNLFNQMADNETTLRTGRNMEESNFRKEYSYRYTQRTIYTGQLGGQHAFNHKRTQIDWTVAYSASRRQDPDWKRARYTKDFSSPNDDPYYLYIPGTSNPSPFFLGRIFMNVNEDIYAGTANIQQAITLGADSASKRKGYTFNLKAGAYIEQKERSFSIRNIGYVGSTVQVFSNSALLTSAIEDVFDTANINQTNGLEIAEDTKGADQYTASNTLQAGYLMAVLPLGTFKGKTDQFEHERVKVNAGLRIEHNIQRLNSNTIQGDTVDVNNDITSVLPSVNIAFNLSDRMLLRTAYGKTINRPEFREIAPLYFYDFNFNSINTGNPNLKTPQINNYDFRWEFYPRAGENISAGIFYKQFTNAIEVYFVPGVGSGGTRSFTWGNAQLAKSFGLEIEYRKKLDSIDLPVIRNLGIVSNAALIHSRVELDSMNSSRPMMGQSPWIVNAGIFYQNDSSGFQVNASYNIIGPRVVIVGVPGIPEVYEMPRHQLDLSVVKSFGRDNNIDVRFSITDLLNQENLLMQDANGDGRLDRKTDQRMQYYKRGTYYTIGVNVRLTR